MRRVRADAAQVPGRAHQRARAAPTSPAHRPAAGGGGGGGGGRRRRWRRRLQPPQHPHSGAGHRAAAGVHRAADGEGSRRSPASSTSTRTSSRRSPSCGSTSTARARPTSASTSTRSPTTCARWSAAKKCRSSRTATISSRSCCASTSRIGTIPPTMGDLLIPGRRRGRTVKVSDVAQLQNELGPASIDRYNRQRQISVQRQPAGRAARRSARGRAREGRRTAPEAGYQAVFGGSARTLAEASSNFIDRAGAGGRLHLHGAGVAVQQLRPPADDHDVAAAQPAGRPARADGVRHDDQRLQRDRPDDAVRHREEELDPAGRLHEHAARAGHGAARGADRTPTTSGCGRF